ncbi:MAG TPA: XdhC family protein, partial [Bacillales bacterium]|nr:XdhC family protein [Bacillales bacterium]
KDGEYLFLPKEGNPYGRWAGDDFPLFKGGVKSGMIQGFFQHLFYPKPRLIIFGAGPDVRPLVSLAGNTGYSTLVCDWRPEFCKKEYFPEVDELIIGFPKEIIRKIEFTPFDFVVVASHHFPRDREVLTYLPRERIRYIGVLGPKERTKRLIGKTEIPANMKAPIGLSIGAIGPEEIAISIMAELLEEWRKPLKNWNDPE